MDRETQERIEKEADAWVQEIEEASENDTLDEFCEEHADGLEVKTDLDGDVIGFEFLLAGGGPTVLMDFDDITVSWGSNSCRRSIDSDIGNKIWDWVNDTFTDRMRAKYGGVL